MQLLDERSFREVRWQAALAKAHEDPRKSLGQGCNGW